MKRSSRRKSTSQKVLAVLITIFCVITTPLIIINSIVIIKSFINPVDPPSVFGYSPLIVLTGSMEGEDGIDAGDLIFIKKCNPEALAIGDIITFRSGADQTPVTHRIININYDGSDIDSFITKGDANNTIDAARVYKSNIIGVFVGKISRAGDFVMYIQQPAVMILLIAVPLLVVLAAEFIRRGHEYKAEKKSNERLKQELERLKSHRPPNGQ